MNAGVRIVDPQSGQVIAELAAGELVSILTDEARRRSANDTQRPAGSQAARTTHLTQAAARLAVIARSPASGPIPADGVTSELLPVSAWCQRTGFDPSYARKLCRTGRLPGAVQPGRDWLIPANAEPTTRGEHDG